MSPRPDEDSTTQATTVTTPDSTEDIVVKPAFEDDTITAKPSLDEDNAIAIKPSLQVSEVKKDAKSEEDTGVEGKAIVEAGGVATLAKILTEKIEKEKIVEVVKTADKAVEVNKIDEHKVLEEPKVVEEPKVAEEHKVAEVKSTEAASVAVVEVPMTATSLVYWENPIESGLVLGGVFSLLLCLSSCSLLTVLSLASLYTLAGVLGVRLFTFLMIKTGRASHGYDPLGKVSGMAWSLPETAITSQAASVTAWINFLLAKSKSLFLLEKPLESLKFSLALYLVSFIGALFNVLTLVTVAWAALCSLPRLYRTHQAAVDQGLEKAKVVASEIKVKAMAKIDQVKTKVMELVEGAKNKMMGKVSAENKVEAELKKEE
jgi:hypothetical protein